MLQASENEGQQRSLSIPERGSGTTVFRALFCPTSARTAACFPPSLCDVGSENVARKCALSNQNLLRPPSRGAIELQLGQVDPFAPASLGADHGHEVFEGPFKVVVDDDVVVRRDSPLNLRTSGQQSAPEGVLGLGPALAKPPL